MRIAARVRRIAVADIQRRPMAVPAAEPVIAASANQAVASGTRAPPRSAPVNDTAEFTRMNGGESAAVRFGETPENRMRSADRNTPPPTPERPDAKPVNAPAVHARTRSTGPSCEADLPDSMRHDTS